jgi:hypothetical protein
VNLRSLTLGIIALIVFSCRNSNDFVVESSGNLKESILNVDTIRIDLDSLGLNAYDEYSYVTNNGSEYLLCLNQKLKGIDIFNLTTREFSGRFFFNDKRQIINDVRAFYAKDFSSMYLISPGKLIFTDSTGEVDSYINLYKLVNGDYKKYGEPAVTLHFPLNHSHHNNKPTILLYTFRQPDEYVSADIVLELQLQDSSTNLLPIQYSDYFKNSSGKLGFLTYMNLGEVNEQYIVYNFVYESNIYRYTRSNGTIEVYGGTVAGVNPLAKTFNGESDNQSLSIHALENPHYFRLLHDSEKHLYYRPVWKQIDYEDSNGLFNSFVDKELLISVFDSQFRLLDNLQLPKNTYSIHRWFVSKNGLALSPTHPSSKFMNENTLEFHIFSFSFN